MPTLLSVIIILIAVGFISGLTGGLAVLSFIGGALICAFTLPFALEGNLSGIVPAVAFLAFYFSFPLGGMADYFERHGF